MRNLIIALCIVLSISVLRVELIKNQTIEDQRGTISVLLISTDSSQEKIFRDKGKIEILEKDINQLTYERNLVRKEVEELKAKLSKVIKPTPVVKRGIVRQHSEPVKASPVVVNGRTYQAEVTGYCACIICCGKTNGITASGAHVKAGVTLAAPKNFPFGTRIDIPGIGIRVVQDRGGAIKGNHLDIFFDRHSDALKFGRRTLNVTVLD